MTSTPLNPILKIILVDVYDEDSDLYVLRGIPHLVEHIWKLVVHYWKQCIEVGQLIQNENREGEHVIERLGYFVDRYDIKFPKPINININMMPFLVSHEFKGTYLPDYLKAYWDNIIKVCLLSKYDLSNKICYLTVQESFVEENTSQRRPGIYTETHNVVKLHTNTNEHTNNNGESKSGDVTLLKKGGGSAKYRYSYCNQDERFQVVQWAQGCIYMASSVDDSCKIWNCRIMADQLGNEIIGEHGDISHIRQLLPEAQMLEKNAVYWLTDRTPHESLRLKRETYGQFYRLVTHDVTVWFKDHSTANPNGLLPDPTITKIVSGSKFDAEQEKNDLRKLEPFIDLATLEIRAYSSPWTSRFIEFFQLH